MLRAGRYSELRLRGGSGVEGGRSTGALTSLAKGGISPACKEGAVRLGNADSDGTFGEYSSACTRNRYDVLGSSLCVYLLPTPESVFLYECVRKIWSRTRKVRRSLRAKPDYGMPAV